MAYWDDDDELEEPVIVQAKCIAQTEKAILVEIRRDQQWIPQSVILDDSEVWKEGDEGKLVIAAWFAEKERLR